MTTATTTKLVTADEFFDWCNRPENRDRRFELEQGRIVEMSRPGELHGVVCANTVWLFGSYIRHRKKGYVVGNDAGIIWESDPDIVRGPDLFYYDRSRPYEDLNPKYTEDVPTLVAEVLSPNDRMNKVLKRVFQFLKWGVLLVWVIDPEDQTVAIYRNGAEPEILDATQEIKNEPHLPGFQCRVAEFFFVPENGSAPAPANP